jgi:hypothetical protein
MAVGRSLAAGGELEPMDQGALARALRCFRTFPDHPARVRLVQSHLSTVFLTPSLAYEIKKAVDLGFAGFSTLARHRRFCRVEVAINRRFAPSVYLGFGADHACPGTARRRRAGAVIEYAVVMERGPCCKMSSFGAEYASCGADKGAGRPARTCQGPRT